MLVFLKEGYASSGYSYNAKNLKKIRVILTRESAIEGIEILAYTDKSHELYINLFLKEFLGSNSKDIKIKNPKDILFAYEKSSKTLYAKAKKPLIIENNFLGYKIEYQLFNFSFNKESKLVMFSGTTHFTNISGNAKSKVQWKVNRLNTYYGSTLHFFREAYAGTLQEIRIFCDRALKE